MASTLKMQRDLVTQRVRVSLTGTYTAASDANSSGPSQTFSASTLTTRAANGDNTQGASIAAGVLTITPGFTPGYVKVINATDRLIQEWYRGFNTGDFLEEVAAGDKTLETDDKVVVNATTGVVTILADGGAITDNDTVVVVIEP